MQDPNVPQPKKDSLDKQKRDLLRELQNEFQNLKVKLADLEKEEFDRIKQRIYYEIDALVQARGLEMVFEKQWLYFPRDGADITDELLRTLDARGGAQPRRGPPPGNGNGQRRPPPPPQGQN
jgi:Skp family chaperone for outer membrane proteins